jgi:uncharacterized repeat protein (TIGR03803 family)
MSKFNWGMRACGALLLWTVAAVAVPAQTFTTLHSFGGKNGKSPYAGLVQSTSGDFYGTTLNGGSNVCKVGERNDGCGTVYKITASGKTTTLLSFDGTDGEEPAATLVQGTDGNFYGTTQFGGANDVCTNVYGEEGCGTMFKITPSGTLMTLYSFCSLSNCMDGANPKAALIQTTDGNLYGTTQFGGGSTACKEGCGTVFKITRSGTLTTLHSFDSTDGATPSAGLVQATDGNFYGTTEGGGLDSRGTVFKITPSGTLKTLYSFDGTDGEEPEGDLVQATDGNFYGTTTSGGANFEGMIFKITPNGTLTTLHSFDFTDGEFPIAGLVQGTDGNFYGTTESGGGVGLGTIFELTPSGTLTTLHSFCSDYPSCTDGNGPTAGLIQGTDGNFYGTTLDGGPNDNACSIGCGTVFSLSVGLGPFVETEPTSRRVGKHVKILGTNLTGSTSVSFNGTAASFTVVSASEITTTVPTGATTGTVMVVTPNGTLSSNVPFRVTP